MSEEIKTSDSDASYKVVALLPMKANSERVVGKNFRNFNGKPLFAWILDALLDIGEIEKIIINTDAREILSENGLEETHRVAIRDRRKALCGDEVSMNLVIEDDVRAVDSDIYIMTHTTNPLLRATTISAALKRFMMARKKQESVDSLFTVNKIQSRFYRADGSAINHDPGNLIPTQDLEPWFEENSNLYIFTRESFMANCARIGTNALMYEMDIAESIDIDTEADWRLAEALVRSRGAN